MSRMVAFAPVDMTAAMFPGMSASKADWPCRAAARRSASCVDDRAADSSWLAEPRWCRML